MIKTLTIFLSLLIIFCIVIIYIIPNENVVEKYSNYQDVKTKTLNWCDKMQKAGLLSPDNFNQCVTSFKENSLGLLPKQVKIPQTGLSRNYSIYNSSKSSTLSSNGQENNSNTIMLSNNQGLTIAVNSDNTLYTVSNINDPNINQKDLYFTLIPQNTDKNNNTVYSILSPYGKYLIANANYTASFTGTSIGTMAAWSFTPISSTSSLSNNVLISSIYYNNFNLVNEGDNLKLIYGMSDNMQWIMTYKENNTNEINTFTAPEYIVTKENILHKMKTTQIQKSCIKHALNTLMKLSKIINDNFVDIVNYVDKKLSDSQNIYKLSKLDYETRITAINQNSMIDDASRSNLLSTIPQPSGLNISNDDIMIVTNKIQNYKNQILQNLHNNVIQPLQQKFDELNKSNLDSEFNIFLETLKTDISNTTNRIKQNNTVMNRQKSSYNTITNEYSKQSKKQEQLENNNTIANANIEMINNFNNQNAYLTKLYPICILILLIILTYLSYLTFIKFKNNIWMKY